MGRKSQITRVAAGVIALAAITGCSSLGGLQISKKDQRYEQGQYAELAMELESRMDLIDPATNSLAPIEPDMKNILGHLEAGENWRMKGNHKRSIEHYDAVEMLFKDSDTQTTAAKVGEGFSSALLNDNARDYDPTPAERILANYYKALSFWSLGQTGNARVEFNRADERARRAVDHYSKEIRSATEDADKASAKNGSLSENMQSAPVRSALDKNFPNIGKWEVFNSFVNPAVAYTNALFLAQGSGGDIERAEDLLKRVAGMVGGNSIVEEDLLNIRTTGRITQSRPSAWIMFEGGLSPTYIDKRFKTPWVTPVAVLDINVALPEMRNRPTGMSSAAIKLNGSRVGMAPLATMEKVMRTEFDKRWPATQARAFASAVAKAIVQNTSAEVGGVWGNLAGIVYSAITTGADVRQWKSLPEQWGIAKVNASRSQTLELPYGMGLVKRVEIPAGNAFIYIKQPTPAAEPMVQVLPFQRT